MKRSLKHDRSHPVLNYETPTKEPLGRWFLRRAIIFLIVILATVVALGVMGKLLNYYGLLEFMAQD